MAKIKKEMDEKYTRFEIAKMLGSRGLQLSMGAPMLIKLSKKDLEALNYNPIEIAKMEFEKGVLPIAVRKPKA